MSTIRAFIRTVNKNKAEQPISVVWQSRSEKYVVASGHFINPTHFKRERVVGEHALTINSLLTQIKADLELAEGLLEKNGIEATAKSMKDHYLAIVDERSKGSIPKPHVYMQAIGAEVDDSKLLVLQEDLEERLKNVRRVRSTFMTHKDDLLVTYFENQYDLKRDSLALSSRRTYMSVSKLIYAFNPNLSIRDVTSNTLHDFQNFLVKRELANETIHSYLFKVISILNQHQEELNLSLSYKQYVFKLPKREENILYFEQNELQELISFESARPHLNRVRDIMLLMCSTGLRFSDVFFNGKECIKGDIIYITTRKTKQGLTIPLTPMSKSVMERNNYQLKQITLTRFLKCIREICATLPSLQYEETSVSYNGQNQIRETKPKWLFIGGHTGRRTFINLCIDAGIPFSKISAITGHKKWDTFSMYADKRRKLDEYLSKVTVFG